MQKTICKCHVSKAHALEQLLQITGLDKHHIYFASPGELYPETSQRQSEECFQKALHLTVSVAEKQLAARQSGAVGKLMAGIIPNARKEV